MEKNSVASIILLLGFMTCCTCIPPAPNACPVDFPWVRAPLRTAEQKAKGYAGGEMCQMPFSIAISKSDPTFLAVGIDTAAVYISSDGGRCWQLKRAGIISNGVQSVAFDPKNAKVLWAAGLVGNTEDKNQDFSNPKADGIYRTTDGGESWQLLRNGGFLRHWGQGEYFAFDERSFDGTQCTTVYAATHEDGVLKSTDAGDTWEVLGFPKTIVNAVILHPMNPDVLFVAADAGLFRSDDAGGAFRKIGVNLPASMEVLGLALNPMDANVLYVAMGKAGIWRSVDGGMHFQKWMNGISEWDIANWTWGRLCISPVNPARMYAEPHQVGGPRAPYWSSDGGATWNPSAHREASFSDVSSEAGRWCVEPIVAHPMAPDTAFQAGNSVRKTTDGGRTWIYSSDGISGIRRETRTSIAFRPEDPKKMVFFHTDFGSAITTDGGDTFSYLPPPPQYQLNDIGGAVSMRVGACDPTPGSKKLISAVGGWSKQLICISEDDCRTWRTVEGTEGYYRFISIHPQTPGVVYAGREADSLRSRDGGDTWTSLPYQIMAMSASNGDIVFAAKPLTANKGEWQVLRSMDQGDTWAPLPGKIIGGFRDLDVDPSDPDRLYAAGDNGVWVFDGNGWSVRGVADGLEKNVFGSLAFSSIAVDPTRPSTVYAGQLENWRGISRGIFRSTDSGRHWKNITANLGPDLSVWAITVSPHDGTVWLGTDIGSWKLPPQAIVE